MRETYYRKPLPLPEGAHCVCGHVVNKHFHGVCRVSSCGCSQFVSRAGKDLNGYQKFSAAFDLEAIRAEIEARLLGDMEDQIRDASSPEEIAEICKNKVMMCSQAYNDIIKLEFDMIVPPTLLAKFKSGNMEIADMNKTAMTLAKVLGKVAKAPIVQNNNQVNIQQNNYESWVREAHERRRALSNGNKSS